MVPDAILESVAAVVAQVLPHLRAAVDTCAQLDVVVISPAELAQTIIEMLLPGPRDAWAGPPHPQERLTRGR